MSEPGFIFNKQWHGRCFICGTLSDEYDTAKRLCMKCRDRYRRHPFFEKVSDLKTCFATIMPEVAGITAENLNRGFSDLFLGTGKEDFLPKTLLEKIFPSDPKLPCGQPALVEAKSLARFAGFGSAWILDLSPYIWSGTLKDLRSWAVLSVAIEHQIRHLAVWTAGNAGLSLAKLVHRWNVTQRDEKQRKTVYCPVDTSVPPEVVVTLRSLQCRVAPISTGRGAVLSRGQVYQVVSSMVGEQADYWQVTDGWDGVGIFIYSLLARQCVYLLRRQLRQVRSIDPDKMYILLPLGTGNFLLGFYRGLEAFGDKRPKLVAALPHGDNVMTPFLPLESRENSRPRVGPAEPVAPKLTGFYSPLSPCLWRLTLDGRFDDPKAMEFITVDRAAQIEVAARVFALTSERGVASEPSALIAFGALRELGERIRSYRRGRKRSTVLVVNSGFGIMGTEEQEFYAKSIFAFR